MGHQGRGWVIKVCKKESGVSREGVNEGTSHTYGGGLHQFTSC